MKTKFLHLLTIVLAICGGILAVADKVTALPFIPAEWTKYWGVCLAGASSIRGIVLVLGDLIDDGQLNGSFKFLLVLALALALGGCVTVYERGQKLAVIGGNVQTFHLESPAGTKVDMTGIDNAIIHKTIGGAVGQAALSAGTALATSGLVPALK